MNDIEKQDFYEAIRSGDCLKISFFLERIELNAIQWDDLPMSEAVLTGRIDVIKTLLNYNFDLNHLCYVGGTFPLERAIESRQSIELISFLLESGADPQLGGCATNPLICAISRQDLQIMQLLIHAGACVNSSVEGGWTPLMEAALIGNIDEAKLLIELGADPRAENDDGESASDIAKRVGNQHCYELLTSVTQRK